MAQNHYYYNAAWGWFVVACIVLLPLCWKLLKVHRLMGTWCWVIGGAVGAWRLHNPGAVPENLAGERQAPSAVLWLVCMGLFWVLLIPFCARLYLKWIQGEMTEPEKREGTEGMRAWLSTEHVFWILAIAFCGWQGYAFPIWWGLLLGLVALELWPVGMHLLRTEPVPAERPVPEDTSLERERVLRLLEQGKITASESAELLNALATSAQSVRASRSASPQQRLIWLGTTLVLLGFFLPWFSIDTGKEVNRVFQQMQQAMPQGAPQMPQMITGVVQVRGGDIAHGLGWVILVAAVAASVLPYFAPEMDGKKRQMLVLGALAAGTFTLVYLLTDSIRYASIGMLFCLAGYAVCLAGAIKEWRAAAWA